MDDALGLDDLVGCLICLSSARPCSFLVLEVVCERMVKVLVSWETSGSTMTAVDTYRRTYLTEYLVSHEGASVLRRSRG